MFKQRRVLVVTSMIVLILSACIIATAVLFNNMLAPVDATSGEEVLVEIPTGATTAEIADILTARGLIRNALIFRLYSRWIGTDGQFIAGDYRISYSMSVQEIIEKIANGDVFRDTTWFTVPEGFTVEQIAERLAGKGLVDKESFLEKARHPEPEMLDRYPFLREVDERVNYVLEGYLFPDTYEILNSATEDDILHLMLDRMVQVFDDELLERSREIDLTMHQILTLASIVEREARVEHERKRIAGVFYNRLNSNYPLQSCATVQYVLNEAKEILTNKDLETPSPYNTYLYPGLPPGPIAAPGESSIRVALYPEETDYFYFVYKQDDSGEHYFARTLAEHNQNCIKAEQNRNQQVKMQMHNN